VTKKHHAIFPEHEQGTPDTLWRNGRTILKYPTEVTALNHLYAPHNPTLSDATNTLGDSDKFQLCAGRCGRLKAVSQFPKTGEGFCVDCCLVCNQCGLKKPPTAFGLDARNVRQFGRRGVCKLCEKVDRVTKAKR